MYWSENSILKLKTKLNILSLVAIFYSASIEGAFTKHGLEC